MDKQASANDVSQTYHSWIVRCLIVCLPASLLPDGFPLHPHAAFGFGLIGGLVVQYFIPPRGKHFWLLLAAAAVLIAIHVVLK